MFEKKNTKTEQNTDQQDQETAPQKSKSKEVATKSNDDKVFDEMFDFAKKSKGIEITADYLDLSELEEKKNYLFVFTGMTTFTSSENGEQPAVMLVAEDKQQYIVASKVIVSACDRIKDEVPVMIGVTVNGKVKSAKGSYYDCKVIRY